MENVWVKKGGAYCFVVCVGAIPHESVGVVVFAVSDSVRTVFDGIFDYVDVEKLL